MGYTWRGPQFGLLPNAHTLDIPFTTDPLDKQARDRIDLLTTLQLTIRDILNEEQQSYADKDDAKSYTPPFSVNDKVWLYTPNLAAHPDANGRRKFQPLWNGPFEVVKIRPNKVTYELRPCSQCDYSADERFIAGTENDSSSPTLVVHVSRLKLFLPGRSVRDVPKPPSTVPEDLSLDLDDPGIMAKAATLDTFMPRSIDVIAGNSHYDVSHILDRKKVNSIRGPKPFEYLVRFKDYPQVADKWLRKTDLAHCKSLVTEYDATLRQQSMTDTQPTV